MVILFTLFIVTQTESNLCSQKENNRYFFTKFANSRNKYNGSDSIKHAGRTATSSATIY